MTMSRRRHFVSVVVIATSALTVAACSSSGSPAASSVGGTVPATASMTTTTFAGTSSTMSTVVTATTSGAVTSLPTTDETAAGVPDPAPVVPVSIAEATGSTVAPTTTSDPRPVDEPSRQLALAMTLQPADFPEPWTVQSASGPLAITPSQCSYRPEGAVTLLANGAAQRGATMQIGTSPGFTSSLAFAFPEESLAQEYVGVVNTDAWAECSRKNLEDAQAAAGFPDVKVAVGDRTYDGIGKGGSEGYLQLTMSRGADVIYQVTYYTYRLGRVVGVVTLESGALDAATAKALGADEFAALSKAYDRVNALNDG